MKKLYYVDLDFYDSIKEIISLANYHFECGFYVITNCRIGEKLCGLRFKDPYHFRVCKNMTTLRSICSSNRKLHEDTVFIIDAANTNSYDFYCDYNDDIGEFDFDIQKIRNTRKFDYICYIHDNDGEIVRDNFN